MSNSSKASYAYVTKSSNSLSIIFGLIIMAFSIFVSDNSLSEIILGAGFGMASFSIYELLYSKSIKENKDIISGIKIIDLNKYIAVNKYNTPLSIIIGLSAAYIGVSILSGFMGMVLLGFGIEISSTLSRLVHGAEKNPLF